MTTTTNIPLCYKTAAETKINARANYCFLTEYDIIKKILMNFIVNSKEFRVNSRDDKTNSKEFKANSKDFEVNSGNGKIYLKNKEIDENEYIIMTNK